MTKLSNFGFYVQSRFAGWWLMNHGGSPRPSHDRLLQENGFGILLETGGNILLDF